MRRKISCECLRVGVLVGDDQYFAGTGNKVDANLSVALALGLSDILVAGTDNHVDRKNALGTIGERCNGLHAAESVDFIRAGEIVPVPCATGEQVTIRLTPATLAGVMSIMAEE